MAPQNELERLYCICIGVQGNVEAYHMDTKDEDTHDMRARPTPPLRKPKDRRCRPQTSGINAKGRHVAWASEPR